MAETHCAEADRLAQAAASYQQRLREARSEMVEAEQARERLAGLRDGRHLAEQKDRARLAYRAALGAADSKAAVERAASDWLREIDRLNRQLDEAEKHSGGIYERLADLERRLPGIELAADAARIAAEAAQDACVAARRALAACEEEAQARSNISETEPLAVAAAPQTSALSMSLVLRGDRQAQLGLALRLAEETGIEAGRLQLLMIELRDQIAARALDEHFVGFPPEHPFWSQFKPTEAREVVSSLATMGYRFDGRGGWAFGRAPTAHDLALALSYCGYDPRALRRPAGQGAIDELWLGSDVHTEEYLGEKVPDLELGAMMKLLGNGAAGLGELWDIWGRLRPLLLSPNPA
jgi:hypothetical protein